MYDFLMKMVSESDQGFILYDSINRKVIFANELVQNLYEDSNKEVDLGRMFPPNLNLHQDHELIRQTIADGKSVTMIDIITHTGKDEEQLVDLELGALGSDPSRIYLKLSFKLDVRYEGSVQQINISHRAEAILSFDMDLTILHCNYHVYEVLGGTGPSCLDQYDGMLSRAFIPEKCAEIVEEIRLGLRQKNTFHKNVQIRTLQGVDLWYSLDLQRRQIDQKGEKIMAYLTNIQKEMETAGQLADVNEYFSVVQTLTNGLLYRYDIKEETLYRNTITANYYHIPAKVEQYPDMDHLNDIFHPDDILPFVDYFSQVKKGIEGTHRARFLCPLGNYQYHQITFKPLVRSDGTVNEMIGNAVNIQDFVEKEQELKNVNEYLNALQELSDDLLFMIDIEKKCLIRRIDKAKQSSLETVVQDFPESICQKGTIHPEDIPLYMDFGRRALGGEAGDTVLRMKQQNEDYAYQKIVWTPITNPQGAIKQMFGKLVNIQSVLDLQAEATYDKLTTALNKNKMEEMCNHCLKESIEGEQHAFVFFDLDNFKYVNDNLGHAFGDFLLQELGNRLGKNIRKGDLLGRVGGDEFTLLIRHLSSEKEMMQKAQGLLAFIGKNISDGSQNHTIHASIGIAMYPQHGTTYQELYKAADVALYESKRQGKNVATLFSENLL